MVPDAQKSARNIDKWPANNAQTWCTTADFYDEEASDRISMKLTKKQRNETAQGTVTVCRN